MTRLRGAGRAISVTAGATAASILAIEGAEPAAVAAAVGVALTSLAATRGSRWYVTGGFTTFLVILLLVYGAPGEAESRLVERVGETLLGVGVALIFGVVLPGLRHPPGSRATVSADLATADSLGGRRGRWLAERSRDLSAVANARRVATQPAQVVGILTSQLCDRPPVVSAEVQHAGILG